MDTTSINSAGATTHVVVVNSQNLRLAIHDWTELLGREHVRCDDAALDQYAKTTLPQGNRSLAVLRPENSGEVCELVKIAARHRVPIYPISRGKNWGYGDSCPAGKGQVIVDLGRMNRILEVNHELAYAVIEPGVTQGQFAKHLDETGSGLILDVTGAGPNASIVGNTLERGFGHTPYGDHFAHSCGMEVVLADGSVLNTGFGAFENAKAAHVFPWGIGPSLDGLFTQSNFGVVTKLCMHLMPKSPMVEAFALRLNSDQQLGRAVDRLRELRLAEVVRSTVHIANDLRVLSSRDRFQAEIADSPSPLPEDVRNRLRKTAGLGTWNIFGGLYGPRELRRGLRSVVRKAFRDVGRVIFFDRRKLQYLKGVTGVLQRFGVGTSLAETATNADAAFELLEGVPTAAHLRGASWRSNSEHSNSEELMTTNGLIWVAPVLPMRATDCFQVTTIIEKTLSRYGFDPLMTLSAVTPRAMCCVASIHYDKTSTSETQRASDCYREVLNKLINEGYWPYRIGAPSMQTLTKNSREYWQKIRSLQRSLDPAAILSPNRYSTE